MIHKSQQRLADALGVSRQLINYHVKRGQDPPDTLDDVAWRVYLESVSKGGVLGDMDDTEVRRATLREKLRLAKEKADEAVRDNQIAAGELIDRATISDGLARAIGIMFSELDRVFCAEVPARVKGRDEIGIRHICRTEIERLKESLKEKFAEMGKG